jgi:hypothetical protein
MVRRIASTADCAADSVGNSPTDPTTNVLSANRAVDLDFSPSELPNLSFPAIRQFQTTVLMTRAPHQSSFVEATRMAASAQRKLSGGSMVNIFGKRRPSRPSSFSAKSPGQKRGIAIVSRPGLRESGDCGPFSAASLGECGATLLLHRCPRVARRRIHVWAGTGWETERTSMAGMRTLMDSLVKSPNSSRFGYSWGCSINADSIYVKRA